MIKKHKTIKLRFAKKIRLEKSYSYLTVFNIYNNTIIILYFRLKMYHNLYVTSVILVGHIIPKVYPTY